MRLRVVRHGGYLAAAALAAAIAFPLGAIASHQFTDVPTSNAFHADIDAIRDAGVTAGCSPTKYCPKDFVTREEMAAFLNRLGALGSGKAPVVNADKVDGKDDVLGAGNIVIRQNGPWFLEGSGTLVIKNWIDTTTIERASAGGLGGIVMPLQEPGTIDGQAYGFQSVQVCWHSSTNTTITNTTVGQTTAASFLVEDGTVRPMIFPDCYTVSDATPSAAVGATRLYLNVSFSAAGEARIGNIVTTWVPIP